MELVYTLYFRTPAILSKIGPNQTSACWRKCEVETANHAHIFSDNFWIGIFDLLDKIIGLHLPPRDPLLAILGAFPEVVRSRKKIYFKDILHILYVLQQKEKTITLSWPKKKPVTHDTW